MSLTLLYPQFFRTMDVTSWSLQDGYERGLRTMTGNLFLSFDEDAATVWHARPNTREGFFYTLCSFIFVPQGANIL